MTNNERVLLNEILAQESIRFEQTLSDSEVFEFYSAEQLLKEYELSDEEISSGMSGDSLDGGADSVYIFINGDLIKEDSEVQDRYKKNPDIELVIIQSKRESGFGEDALLKFSRLTKNLLDLEFERRDFEGRYNDKVLDVFELFKKTYVSLITKRPRLSVRYYYCSLGSQIHENTQKQADDLLGDAKAILPNADIQVTFIGAGELIALSQERPTEVFRLPTTDSPLSTSEKVFIALTNIKDYYHFISDDSGKLLRSLLESNVRDYQGKNSVNKEIQSTLLSRESQEFWWLNNGITILATDATTPGGRELIITNPQIVNGLQTSKEIHRFFTDNPDRIESEQRGVLVRVIVPEDDETRDSIIRATNSQTPIPKSSLRATHFVHRNIEEYFKSRGLFYDRRKNFYKNEGRKPREIISIPFLSQCLMSIIVQRPDTARARPSTLLENDESYDKLFNENNSLEMYFIAATWGRSIELRLKEQKEYETTEISDIKFYVLYFTSVLKVNSLYPNNRKISELTETSLSAEEIDQYSAICYDIYRELGGTDKIAKGTDLLDNIKAKLRADYLS